jgi:regulator of protease activity HflC (stomatin/prohibitin superfamily)
MLPKGVGFDAIFCDLMMPEMDGMRFYDEVSHVAGGVTEVIAFLSGGVDDAATEIFLARTGRPVLEKPFDPEGLREYVRGRVRRDGPLVGPLGAPLGAMVARTMDPLAAMLLPLFFVLLILVMRSVRQVNQWQVALRFTLGKYTGRMEPGISIVLPLLQQMVVIDTRIRNRDLPAQMVITKDNVTAMIDAVVYYKVVDPEKATLNVENYETAVRDRAKVVLRDIAGETTLDDLLQHRDEVAAKVRLAVEQFVAQWGLHVELIALQDIQLPQMMQEVIAKKAIAERERQFVIIKSQADVESAKNFAEAARILTESPGAMELRRLEALQTLTGHRREQGDLRPRAPDGGAPRRDGRRHDGRPHQRARRAHAQRRGAAADQPRGDDRPDGVDAPRCPLRRSTGRRCGGR